MPAMETVYKGNPTISLKDTTEQWYPPFNFGLAKAKTILRNLDSIILFVKKNDPEFFEEVKSRFLKV